MTRVGRSSARTTRRRCAQGGQGCGMRRESGQVLHACLCHPETRLVSGRRHQALGCCHSRPLPARGAPVCRCPGVKQSLARPPVPCYGSCGGPCSVIPQRASWERK